MDKLESYRNAIQQIIHRHSKHNPSHGAIEAIPVCDTANDNFMLLDAGWDCTGRVHAVALHLRILDGKIKVEWDGTEYGIAQELIDAGVPSEEIVLSFYRPDRLPRMERAAA